MGIEEINNSPKPLVSGSQLARGSVELEHLSPGLYAEIRKIALHSHTGVGSRKVATKDLDGPFTKDGFIIFSSDGTKRYRIQINNSGILTSTEI